MSWLIHSLAVSMRLATSFSSFNPEASHNIGYMLVLVKPGKVLTSMLKRVDNAVYEAFSAGENLETGNFQMGIANGGVGYALDEHNASLVSDAMKSAVDAAAASIANGSMAVHNYTDDETCPAISF